MRTAVVLPAPLGPSTPRTVPGAASRSMPSSARTSPYDLTSPATAMAGPRWLSLMIALAQASQAFRTVPVLNMRETALVSETTSSRLLTLLSLLQGRRDWPGQRAGRAARGVAADDPPRRRAAAPARLPGRVDDRPGGRLPARAPAPRCRRCCSTTTRRSRSPSACAPRPARSVTRHRGDVGARARQARAGAAGAPAPPRAGAAGVDRRRSPRPAGRRSTRSTSRSSPPPAATASGCASATRPATAPAAGARSSRTRS